ncbi:MAG: amidase [Lachnospiraceae bacterium]|nr:amidase [Lachnospiraceae bacterium]
MKKRLILLLVLVMCMLSAGVVFAEKATSSIRITEDKTIEYNKEELLAALYEADIESVREALDMRLVTCRELTEYYLERIEAYNPTFNCFITLCDNVLAEADKRDAAIEDGTAKGKLFGVPIVVKDNIKYEGYYTTNGKEFSESEISDVNAAVVQYMLDEGAVIIGKTNMSKEAESARRSCSDTVGETLNAYNTKLAAGGSSGGSSVATTLNFAVASLGTDTNSSLRFPAALSSCVSLRPTYGLVDRTGCITLNRRRDVAGAITRTVKDQAIMLDILVGGGTYTENLDANALEGMRIGLIKELTYKVSGRSDRTAAIIDDEIEAAFANAVEEFKACGAEVVEVSMPDIFKLSKSCLESREGWANAKDEYYAAFEKLLADNKIEAVIFPTYLSSPQYTGKADDGGLLVYDQPWTSNCSILSSPLGLPEISVPIGQHSRGAGIGMEIASLRNSEQLLLNIAYSYTEKYNHRVISELAPNLYDSSRVGDLKTFIVMYKEALAEAERLMEEELIQQETPPDNFEENTDTTQEETTTSEPITTPEEIATSEPTITPEETSSDNFEENADTTPEETTESSTEDAISGNVNEDKGSWMWKAVIIGIGIIVIVVLILVIDRVRVFKASERNKRNRKKNKK